MVIASHQKVRTIDSEINIRVNGNEINRVHSVKSLGVHIDEHLTWSVHIDKLCKKIASAIGVLKRIRPFVTTNTAVQVYKALPWSNLILTIAVLFGMGLVIHSVVNYKTCKTERQGSLRGQVMIQVQVLCWTLCAGTPVYKVQKA